jgi:hypothetical protein
MRDHLTSLPPPYSLLIRADGRMRFGKGRSGDRLLIPV